MLHPSENNTPSAVTIVSGRKGNWFLAEKYPNFTAKTVILHIFYIKMTAALHTPFMMNCNIVQNAV